ncbi:MAG: FAD-binding protein [Oscillospiraceae bacterium]|nr:FAD-binding protein [Oscillospiraceae bacterium]
MLKLSDVRLKERCGIAALRSVAAKMLGVPESGIRTLEIQRLSIDARRRPDVRFVYTLLLSLDDEASVLAKAQRGGSRENAKAIPLSAYTPPERYSFPVPAGGPASTSQLLPVIVGAGPAGLFAALCLAEAGLRCIVLERGEAVEERVKSVSRFWAEGVLNPESNVQFGEGGAGTFSDGKLTTGVSGIRIRYVLEQLVKFGAPMDILYLAKPHIGTDRLRGVVVAIRRRLIELGCDVRFGHRLSDILTADGILTQISVKSGEKTYSLHTDRLILALGNSSRDTFEMLHSHGVALEPKAFSVGVRIEHLQEDIDLNQYGKEAVESTVCYPASDYKLAAHLDGGRSVYTFCVCPGGEVVAAASELGCAVTNGMSHYARDGVNINGGLLVSVTPEDFGGGALGGIALQRELEKAAFCAGGSNYFAPAQLVGDFLRKQPSSGHGKVTPTYSPGVKYCNLWDVLPEFVCNALLEALPMLQKRINGFAHPEAVMTAVETRSSSPVRILRENYEATGIRGIFPCGEGAGYAGGIMSAAVDGIRCAEAVISSDTTKLRP